MSFTEVSLTTTDDAGRVVIVVCPECNRCLVVRCERDPRPRPCACEAEHTSFPEDGETAVETIET